MTKRLFPLFIDLSQIKITIFGAGAVAYRKAKRILEYGGNLRIISPEIREPQFQYLQLDYPRLIIEQREVDFEQDFYNCSLIIAATDNIEFNQQVVDYCQQNSILVNNATSKSAMSASFACSLELAETSIAIHSNGHPKQSLALREQIKTILGAK